MEFSTGWSVDKRLLDLNPMGDGDGDDDDVCGNIGTNSK